jgi:ABC-2 type transport system permease protein
MRPRITAATANRVLLQLRHDPRTIALLLVVPSALIALLRFVFDGGDTFDRIGAPLLGLFPFLTMFLVTSIAMLRERTTGTLDRLLSSPMGKLDLLLGYAVAFAVAAVAQATLASTVAFGLLGLEVEGPKWAVLLLAISNALLGMSLGLLVSAFAKTEFQAVQFMPAFVMPQILLCGLLAPRESMAAPLEWVSNALPLTYAYGALDRVTQGLYGSTLPVYVCTIVAFTLAALTFGALTLRRRTA